MGDLADLTTFSFFPTKNLTTAEGGAVAAHGPRAGPARPHEFHNIGLVRDPSRFALPDEGPWHQEVHEFGLNYRLTDVRVRARAAASSRRLRRSSAARAEIIARYDERAGRRRRAAHAAAAAGSVDPAWHLYPLRVLDGRRREVFERMRAAGIGVQVNYLPVYWHPVFADLGYRRGMCPNAEAFYAAGALAAAVPGPHRRPGRHGRRDADVDPALT